MIRLGRDGGCLDLRRLPLWKPFCAREEIPLVLKELWDTGEVKNGNFCVKVEAVNTARVSISYQNLV